MCRAVRERTKRGVCFQVLIEVNKKDADGLNTEDFHYAISRSPDFARYYCNISLTHRAYIFFLQLFQFQDMNFESSNHLITPFSHWYFMRMCDRTSNF